MRRVALLAMLSVFVLLSVSITSASFADWLASPSDFLAGSNLISGNQVAVGYQTTVEAEALDMSEGYVSSTNCVCPNPSDGICARHEGTVGQDGEILITDSVQTEGIWKVEVTYCDENDDSSAVDSYGLFTQDGALDTWTSTSGGTQAWKTQVSEIELEQGDSLSLLGDRGSGSTFARVDKLKFTYLGLDGEEEPEEQEIVKFMLINADTDDVIGELENGDVINFAELGTDDISIKAVTDPETVGSVRFSLDGVTNFHTENIFPYVIAGDSNGDYNAWTPSLGQHELTATPFTQSNRNGEVGQSKTVSFSVVSDVVEEEEEEEEPMEEGCGDPEELHCHEDGYFRQLYIDADGCKAYRCVYNPSREDLWLVKNGENRLELSEPGVQYENIRDVRDAIGAKILGFLGDQQFDNDIGTFNYQQRILFNNELTEYVAYMENEYGLAETFLYIASGNNIGQYILNFDELAQSDIVGTRLEDFEDERITIMDRSYSIVKAERAAKNDVKLTLMRGAIEDVLDEGETKTYTVSGRDYEVTATFVSDTVVKFNVNGEFTDNLVDGSTDGLADGSHVGVRETLVQDIAGGVRKVEFYLGAHKVILHDTNIGGSADGSENLVVNSELIDDATVTITGNDNGERVSINKIIIDVYAEDDIYLQPGDLLSLALDEPQALLDSWDIYYGGLEKQKHELVYIDSRGKDQYNLNFLDADGKRVSLPIAHYRPGFAAGTSSDPIIAQNQPIHKDQYFQLSDGEVVYRVQYKGTDNPYTEDAVAKFKLINGEIVERPLGIITMRYTTTLTLGGTTYRFHSAAGGDPDDFVLFAQTGLSGSADGEQITFGDDDRRYVANELASIAKNDYFSLTADGDGTANSYIMQYKGADSPNQEDAVLKFKNLGSGQIIERAIVFGSNGRVGTINIGGNTFQVYYSGHLAPSTDDFEIFVDRTGDGKLSDGWPWIITHSGLHIDFLGPEGVNFYAIPAEYKNKPGLGMWSPRHKEDLATTKTFVIFKGENDHIDLDMYSPIIGVHDPNDREGLRHYASSGARYTESESDSSDAFNVRHPYRQQNPMVYVASPYAELPDVTTVPEEEVPEESYCTEDLKLCPDGSYVARDPSNDCQFYECEEEAMTGYDLSSYPEPFVDEGEFNAIIVVGDTASPSDVIASVDIATSLQFAARVAVEGEDGIVYYETGPIEVGSAKLASEVPDIRAQNAIVVGSGCNNHATLELMGNPVDCHAGTQEDKGRIKLFEHGNGFWGLLVDGYGDLDTRRAARVLANYEDYHLVGTEIEIAGTSFTDIIVEEPAMDDEEYPEECSAHADCGLYECADGSDHLRATCVEGECVTISYFENPCAGAEEPLPDCSGCTSNGECIPTTTRFTHDGERSYCEIGGTIEDMKGDGAACINNYECNSNICAADQCVEAGLFARIIAFFDDLIGGSPTGNVVRVMDFIY